MTTISRHHRMENLPPSTEGEVLGSLRTWWTLLYPDQYRKDGYSSLACADLLSFSSQRLDNVETADSIHKFNQLSTMLTHMLHNGETASVQTFLATINFNTIIGLTKHIADNNCPTSSLATVMFEVTSCDGSMEQLLMRQLLLLFATNSDCRLLDEKISRHCTTIEPFTQWSEEMYTLLQHNHQASTLSPQVLQYAYDTVVEEVKGKEMMSGTNIGMRGDWFEGVSPAVRSDIYFLTELFSTENFPYKLFVASAQSPYAAVRYATVSANRHTYYSLPADVIKTLATDDNDAIRYMIAQNLPDTQEYSTVVDNLLSDESARSGFLSNSALTRETYLRVRELLNLSPIASKEELAGRISDYSEEHYAAGWYSGIEDILFEQMGEPLNDVTVHSFAEAARIFGWPRWDDTLAGETYSPQTRFPLTWYTVDEFTETSPWKP